MYCKDIQGTRTSGYEAIAYDKIGTKNGIKFVHFIFIP